VSQGDRPTPPRERGRTLTHTLRAARVRRHVASALLTRRCAATAVAALVTTAVATIPSGPAVAQQTTIINSAVLPPVTGDDPTVFAARGPYGVGVRTIAVGTGRNQRQVELWYPAAAETSSPAPARGRTRYDLKDWLPAESAKAAGPRPLAELATDALRNAPARADAGPFPVVLFSHGLAGFRVQSAFLTTHLASWGFAVAAPDHPSRDLAAALSGRVSFVGTARSADVDDLSATLRALRTSAGAVADLRGRLDTANLSVVGHSAGAQAALRFSVREPSVQAVVALAGGAPRTGDGSAPLRTPVLWISAEDDGIVSARSVRAAFTAAEVPKRLVELAASGHLAFSDVCTIARSSGGLYAVAQRRRIDVPPLLRRLGSDGCDKPNAPVEQAWPAIRQATVAQLRTVLGGGLPGFGLDQGSFDTLSRRGAVRATFAIG
jgi:dienelactone hydrolase